MSSGEASARLTALSARFQLRAPREPGAAREAVSVPVLGPTVAVGFTTEGDRLVPRFAQADARRPRVTLPAQAAGAFGLDEPTGVRAEVTLRGATHAAATADEGRVLYRGGYRGEVDVVHRPTTDGTEDFLAFERAPSSEVVEYELALGERVAGLRLVADTLELLDAEGAPRLRMDPPYIVDAEGRRHAASVRVSGCRVDTDARAPWGRAVVAAGASTCVVGVDWSGKGVAYPALLDPSWTNAASMSTARSAHVAARLPSGRVLVAGGDGTGTTSAEVYDPVSATWTATAPLSVKRVRAAAVTLASGKVLVAGGYDGTANTTTSEVFDEATGTWSPAGAMVADRSGHRMTVLPSGEVLATGGYQYANNKVLVTATTEVYDPATNSWSATAPMLIERADHIVAGLVDGRVLVAGGLRSTFVETPQAEVYDPATKTWSATGNMSVGRGQMGGASLPSGRVLVLGGTGNLSPFSAEVFNPVNGTWLSVPAMNAPRRLPTVTRLASGRVLVAGGFQGAAAELFNEQTSTWTQVPSMASGREAHTATLLVDGRVLVAGGDSSTGRLAAAELFAPELANGQTCALGGECGSGFCVDGICCDTACDGGGCQACAAAKGAPADGTCVVLAKDTVCRAAAGGCDVAETCDGTATACPADTLKAQGDTCRAAAGECDVAETCDGSAAACPNDAAVADGTACTAGVCTAGVCTTGSGGASGAGGAAGESGAAGEAGAAGEGGAAGEAGAAGEGGEAGEAGTAGAAGEGGAAGVGGAAGGSSGEGGESGTSGQSGTAGSSGTGNVSGTGGKAGTGGTAGSAGAAGGARAEVEGGCSCRVTPAGEPAGAFAFAALAAVAAGRRRRRGSVG